MKNTHHNSMVKVLVLLTYALFIANQGMTQGVFTFSLTSDSMVIGIPGAVLNCYGLIENNSADTVDLYIIREEENVPAGWGSAICTDICLPPYIDSSSLTLYPNTSQSYTQYIYTNFTQDSCNILMKFINKADSTNIQYQRFYGQTDSSLIGIRKHGIENLATLVIPNPVKGGDIIYIKNLNGTIDRIDLIDITGKVVTLSPGPNPGQFRLLPKLKSGLYLYRIQYSDKSISTGSLSIIE